MFSLLQKSRHLQLDTSVQVELINTLVRPILSYGSEVWGYGGYACIENIESLQLGFLKYILQVKK